MAKRKQYVNNEEMLLEIHNFLTTGIISNKLHMIFYTMCNHIINRPRFNRCTLEFKEDLIHSGYIKCIKVLERKTFSKDKTNPFSYFTTVITNSYLDVISAENKQKTIKENIKAIYDIKEEIGITG